MDNRLLSEQEVSDMVDFRHDVMKSKNMNSDPIPSSGDCLMIANAQLAKADKEWVEWVKKYKMGCSTGECEFYAGCPTEFCGHYCKAWQSRCKEIGA